MSTLSVIEIFYWLGKFGIASVAKSEEIESAEREPADAKIQKQMDNEEKGDEL